MRKELEAWARTVPNLQTELLLSSKAAFAASFAPLGHRDIAEWRQRWHGPNATATRRALALRVASNFDLLGPTGRFDEIHLLVAKRLNWTLFAGAGEGIPSLLHGLSRSSGYSRRRRQGKGCRTVPG